MQWEALKELHLLKHLVQIAIHSLENMGCWNIIVTCENATEIYFL
jgi:hypothetical protein